MCNFSKDFPGEKKQESISHIDPLKIRKLISHCFCYLHEQQPHKGILGLLTNIKNFIMSQLA